MATIKDVCKAAGVSKATVSRVINNTGQVKESTRVKVEAAIEQLNYRPSSLAQTLAASSGNSIGLVLSDFDGSYFGSLLKQASASATRMGKQLIIADGKNQAEFELQAVSSLVEQKCDVIVLYSRQLTAQQLIELNHEISTPLIHVGQELPESAGYSIAFDQKRAIESAATHLMSIGHRHIAYFGPCPTTRTTQVRLEAFKAITEKQPFSVETQHLVCGFDVKAAYEQALEQIPNNWRFSAIVAASDDIAIGILRACREKGIGVPSDVSIVSIDNEKMTEFVVPQLTTVDIPIERITERAMEVAQQLIEDQVTIRPEIVVGELFVRDSTKPLV